MTSRTWPSVKMAVTSRFWVVALLEDAVVGVELESGDPGVFAGWSRAHRRSARRAGFPIRARAALGPGWSSAPVALR